MKQKRKRLFIAALAASLLLSMSACSLDNLSISSIVQEIQNDNEEDIDLLDDDLFEDEGESDPDSNDHKLIDNKLKPKLSIKKLFGKKDQETIDSAEESDNKTSSATKETQNNQMTAQPAENTTATSIATPTEQQVYDEFHNMRNLYRKWFMPNNVTLDLSDSQGVSVTNPYGGSYIVEAYRVQENGVTSKADLDKLFLSCCDQSYYDSFRTMSIRAECYGDQIQYVDVDGKLYQVADGIIVSSDEESNSTVTKISDSDFEIQFYEILYVASSGYGAGDYYHYSTTLHYKLRNNQYVFCDFSRTEINR